MNGDQTSRDRLKKATKYARSYLQKLAAKKRRKVVETKSADIARAGGGWIVFVGCGILLYMAVLEELKEWSKSPGGGPNILFGHVKAWSKGDPVDPVLFGVPVKGPDPHRI